MKHQILYMLICTVLLSCNLTDQNHQHNITVDLIDPEHPPIFEFDALSHDFGNVALGEKLTHVFQFKNTGESPLLIHSVQPSCHCTVLKDWPKEPIPPGETGAITAQFEGKYAGSNSKSISIMANTDPNLTRLILTASVVGEK
jgi:hypothetical protein